VKWRVRELLKERNWTRYRLVQESGLPSTTVYRISESEDQVRRVDGLTLDALCAAFNVGPGELLEYVKTEKRPPKRSRKRRKA
jgi:DNA-binding Xre family transcriptional regulator